jgi:hypothetical protein
MLRSDESKTGTKVQRPTHWFLDMFSYLGLPILVCVQASEHLLSENTHTMFAVPLFSAVIVLGFVAWLRRKRTVDTIVVATSAYSGVEVAGLAGASLLIGAGAAVFVMNEIFVGRPWLGMLGLGLAAVGSLIVGSIDRIRAKEIFRAYDARRGGAVRSSASSEAD